MISADPHDLASSMIYLYGKAKALSLAQRYADESATNGDLQAHTKWGTVVVVIAAVIHAANAVASP